MNKRQAELWRRLGRRIKDEPKAYDQETFGSPDSNSPCGTAACLAGTLVLELGGTIQLDSSDDWVLWADRNGQRIRLVSDWASTRLGLDPEPPIFGADWRPTGWRPGMGPRAVANRVAADCERIADGADPNEIGSHA